ncbi:high mobility group nucleosome-binding domain-containing protein 5 [Drosophila suzukii]|uniref:High mobility group nucleosome-binding domain-containing protein 5 n=1 Tax=Drosophila suzukii TaxID=28584 RepID=A0AB40A730_DROSZ
MASISKSRGSCSSSRNRLHLQQGSPLLFVIFACLLASCSAQPIESTSASPEIEEVAEPTTTLPIQLEESSSTTEQPILNATTPAHPVEEPKEEEVSPADPVEPTDNFVSVYGGTLEQDIKNDVNSEVEDALSPVDPIIEEVKKAAEAALQNQEIAVLSAREPKTLDAAEEKKPVQAEESEEPEAVTDNIAVSSEQLESRIRPLPNVTSDLVSVILNEDRAITEQPITKTNLLALEQEHERLEIDEDSTPVPPAYEEAKHQVTKKQGVEDPLPIEIAPEVPEEPEIQPSEEPQADREDRQLEESNDKLNEINENSIDDDETPTKTSTSPAPLVNVETTKSSVEPNEEIEKKVEAEAKAEMEAQVEGVTASEETIVEAADPEDTEAEVAETTEASVPEVAQIGEEEPKEEVSVDQVDLKEPTIPIQTSSEANKEENITEEPGKEIIFPKDNSDSAEEKDSDESDEKSISSEEEKEPIVQEAKSASDDSTATPLVSYPPHDAGQTFDSNSADEHSAQLSGPSNYRSTLIIALCSGTAVIFIVASLVIFVVSFQRQHGTLDIEMQEQRLGKDVQDEDNVQMKLLDVDLSTPVILPMGNEETDECL